MCVGFLVLLPWLIRASALHSVVSWRGEEWKEHQGPRYCDGRSLVMWLVNLLCGVLSGAYLGILVDVFL